MNTYVIGGEHRGKIWEEPTPVFAFKYEDGKLYSYGQHETITELETPISGKTSREKVREMFEDPVAAYRSWAGTYSPHVVFSSDTEEPEFSRLMTLFNSAVEQIGAEPVLMADFGTQQNSAARTSEQQNSWDGVSGVNAVRIVES